MKQFHCGPHYPIGDFNNSIIDTLKKTKKIGGNSLQIYFGESCSSSMKTKLKPTSQEAKEIKEFIKKNDFTFFIHGILLLNMSNPHTEPRFKWGVDNLIYDLQQGSKLDAKGVVIHMGKMKTTKLSLSAKEANQNFINTINYVISQTPKKIKVIIETDINHENRIGGTIEEFAELFNAINEVNPERIGCCVDTAHIFAAGYPIHTVDGVKDYFNKFDELIGFKYLDLIHLNDSAAEFDTKKDRHITLTKGFIFKDNLQPLLEIVGIAYENNISLILETRDQSEFERELTLLHKLLKIYKKVNTKTKLENIKVGGNNKINNQKIIEFFRELKKLHTILGNQREAQAYSGVISALEKYPNEIKSGSELKGIPKIGKRTIEKIDEILNTGNLQILHELKSNPKLKSLLELQEIPGIGPKMANKLVEKGIISVDKLKKEANKYKKTGQSNIMKFSDLQLLGLEYHNDLVKRIPREDITQFINFMNTFIDKFNKKNNTNINIYPAGSYRLGKSNSKDIDLILSIQKKEKQNLEIIFKNIINTLIHDDILFDYVNISKNQIFGIIKVNNVFRHIDLRLIDEKYLPYYQLYFGSGEQFSRLIRQFAKDKGYKLTNKEFLDIRKNKKIKVKSEQEIFKKLGLNYVEPEDRSSTLSL